MTDERTIEARIYERLSKVIDPELGRSVTDLGMIAAIDAIPVEGKANTYEVRVEVELTVEGCPLSQTITNQINGAVSSYPEATLLPRIEVGSMSQDKLTQLVAGLKAERKQNPFNKPGIKTRIFAIASGKGGVGKSSVTANLAATFAALGYDTAAIDADIYGFSLPRLFGVHAQPTNLNGMLMPVTAWGVKLISIGMFAGADRAILWRGPRLQRSLEQFLSDVWWGEPDVLLLDLAPGTGDMAISVAQALPNAELVVVTTPQPSASDIAFHFEWIVQGGSRHRRTRNIYGLQYGHWGHTAGAPHPHGDVKQFRIDFLRRVLVGDGPTRSTRGRAQRSLQSQIIHFYDNAVERVFDVSTMLAVVIDHVENLAECGDLTVMWRNGYAPLLIQPIRFGLVVDRIMVGTTFGAPLERSNAMRIEAQPSGGGDARILLPQASGSRVTWIGERRAPSILVFFVERVEIVPSHEDLTADLHEFGNVFFRSRKILRNGGDGAHIERDILADHAVTSGQTLLEHAVTVDEVKRKTVDFHFACHRQRLRLRPIKSPNNTVVPFMQFLKRKDIVKTHHARRVAYRCEIIGEGASDTMRRRLRGIEGWELGFQRL